MAAIIQPQPWTRQPQIPSQVNRGNPLARGLVAAIPNRWDAANNAVNSSQLELVATPRGLLLGPYNISRYATTTVPKVTGAFSIFFDRVWGAGGASQGFVSQGGSSAGGGFSVNTSNDTNFRITFGGIADYSYSTASFSAGDLVRIGVVVSGNGGTARYYVNGVFDSSRSVGTQNTPSTNLILGAAHNGGSYVNPVVSGGLGNVTFFSRALADVEVAQEYKETFSLFQPLSRRIFVGPSAGGGGSTGTVVYTNANDTSAASGSTTIVGTLARTNANDTSAATGTVGSVTGTLAYTNANDTVVASGSTTIIGTLATTNANDTVSASGNVGSAVSGTVAYTNANDTVAASGSTTIVGTLARTNANDTVVASGSTAIVGVLSYQNANDTMVAAGIVGSITGTLAYTNNNDTVVASGISGLSEYAIVRLSLASTTNLTTINDSVTYLGITLNG